MTASRKGRLYTFDTLCEKGIKYSKIHIRRMWHAGRFPKPIYPSPRRPSWTEQMLDEWLDRLERKVAKQPAE
jgi:predicted DNA-binding transcriptional regulator AlpA